MGLRRGLQNLQLAAIDHCHARMPRERFADRRYLGPGMVAC